MNNLKLAGFLTIVILVVLAGFFFFGNERQIDYSTEIKPILNKNCITCHGGVKKSGGFSVLFEEEAFAINESGHAAIIPGDPNGSELIKRLTASDPELRMPYEKEPLSKEEIDLLKTWIKQGAKWGKHWAYQAVQKPKEIDSKLFAGLSPDQYSESSNPRDFFVAKKLEE